MTEGAPIDDEDLAILAVRHARDVLTEAWRLLQNVDPKGDDYSQLRLITRDLEEWLTRREDSS